MPETPRVSVIIVNFNAGRLLAECVLSVLASDCPVEVVVIDNGSKDDSVSILRESIENDLCVQIITQESNIGFAAANNVGIAATKADLLLFLNPDCVVGENTITRVVAELEADAEVGMAGCLVLNPDGSMQQACRRHIPTPWKSFARVSGLSIFGKTISALSGFDTNDEPLPDGPEVVEAISGAFMFVRRTAIERVGLMDEGYFLHCEDLDWCMRFAQSGFKILFVPDALAVHYQGTCSSDRPARVVWHMHKGMIRFYRKFFSARYTFLHAWIIYTVVWIRCALLVLYNLVALRLSARRGHNMTDAYRQPAEWRRLLSVDHREVVIVTGASSIIGGFLIPLLAEAGYEVLAISRRAKPYRRDGHVIWAKADLVKGFPSVLAKRARCLIHLAPIWVLPKYLDNAARVGIKRVVAFSSTSVLSKADSDDPGDQKLVALLADGESQSVKLATSKGIDLTLFRPTMVYAPGKDKNIDRLTTFIRRFGFFPVVGTCAGLRQPVHAEDLAQACRAALNNHSTFGKQYNLGGGQTLTYRELLLAIFDRIGIRPRILKVPPWALVAAVRVLALIPGFQDFSSGMVKRMQCDLCFDHAAAVRDFGYSPRAFVINAGIEKTGFGDQHPSATALQGAEASIDDSAQRAIISNSR
ncbi:MAG: glycosyltransferase [Gammaproteobacteria bacterium]|nr:glycosyltransferase [Gammaproteobacteria bacterium]